MIKRLLCFAITLVSWSHNLFAQDLTPIESFINNVKSTSSLTPINNIWAVNNSIDKTELLTKVKDAQTLTIDYTQVAELIKRKPFAMSLTVPGVVAGSTFTLELGKYDILGNDFKVVTRGDNQTDVPVNYTPGVYYRGVVNGIKGSVAAFSFFNNEVYAIFSIPGVGNYTLVPNTMLGKYYNSNPNYLLYNDKDLLITDKGPKCAADLLPENNSQLAQKTTTTLNNKVFATCNDIRIFELADYSLFVDRGRSTTSVTNYVTALFNNQSVIYKNEKLNIYLNYLQIDTTVDDYYGITSATSLAFLRRFGYNTQNILHGSDLALLLSTKYSAGYGALGGVAYLMSMCNRYRSADSSGPYGYCNMDNSAVVNFPTYSWDVEVLAHETGHIVGSPHTHRCCWNPSGTGTTAIDGCTTLEGSCADPGLPSAGGTIMSYCHLGSAGINFSNGFGTQPGDTVRFFTNSRYNSICGFPFNPNTPVARANRTVTANRECYDTYNQQTYYWYDNNTADRADDTLVLKIKKNNSDIGDLNTTGFSVVTGTNPLFQTNTGQRVNFPAGTPNISGSNYAMRRYWKINTSTTTVTSPIEIFFPYTGTDSSDVKGSLSSAAVPMHKYQLYKTTATIDPNPLNNLSGAVAANLSIYKSGPSATDSTWALSRNGSVSFASFKTTSPAGGGSMFLSSNYMVGIETVDPATGYVIFPNPTTDNWTLKTAVGMGYAAIEIYSADGKLVIKQIAEQNSTTEIPAAALQQGIYFYRLITASKVYTGTLSKLQ